MAWTWIRPADPRLLAGRPLLDLGTGDGQTLRALVEPVGLVVGVDRSIVPMKQLATSGVHVLGADAGHLPFGRSTFGAVLAGDLIHHLNDDQLQDVLKEIK